MWRLSNFETSPHKLNTTRVTFQNSFTSQTPPISQLNQRMWENGTQMSCFNKIGLLAQQCGKVLSSQREYTHTYRMTKSFGAILHIASLECGKTWVFPKTAESTFPERMIITSMIG